MKLTVLGISEYDGRQSYEVDYKGEKHYVNLYKFQESEVVPKELDCNVRSLGDGKVSITQNIVPFLEERYRVGNTYDFVVRNDFSRSGYYELMDKDGFYFRLNALDDLVLYIGQEVKCRVIDMQGVNEKLDLLSYNGMVEVDEQEDVDARNSSVTEEFLVDYIASGRFKEKELEWNLAQLIRLIFLNEEPYVMMVNDYILNIIKELRNSRNYEGIITILKEMRDAILFVLEETDCLNACEPNERKVLQNRLSVIGSTIKNYVKVVGYFSKGQVEEKIGRLLRNLEVSGYVFQAEKQLGVMMLVFSLDNEMMEQQMATLLKIIHGRDVTYWKDEPFRTAFIRLLELFIAHKKEQIDLAIYDVENVKRILEALSIQLLLGKTKEDAAIFDYNLNRSMFYRYASYLKTSTPLRALDNAFLSLIDVNQLRPEYSWRDTESHGLLASKLSTDIRRGVSMNYSKVYKEGNVKLDISDDGIVLQSLQVPEEKLRNALPEGLLPWNQMRVRLETVMPTLTVQNGKDLSVYQNLWSQIERELFAEKTVPVKRQKQKIRPELGDTCDIRVLYRNEDGRLVCRIVDDDYEGDGYLLPKEIVPYSVNMYPELFKNPENGESLVFKAKVVSLNAEEMCHFTLQPFLNEELRDKVNYVDRLPCLITGRNETGFFGVSVNGASVHFTNSEDFPEVNCDDMVFANNWEPVAGRYFSATIMSTEGVASHVFTVEQAFHSLMYLTSIYDYCEFADSTESEVLQQDNLIDRARVKELMNIIDRVASMEKEYLVTYNYLGYAKMLSRMIDDQKRYKYYSGWMNLIAILHHFAVNMVVPTRELDQFELTSMPLFSRHSEIYRKYLQLKVASYKGKPEYDDELWMYRGHDDEAIRGLADCVLAYNLLGSGKDHYTEEHINERIDDFLQIKDHSSKLADFGTEDLHTEFKTSIVYPPKNNMRPDLPKQTEEILKEVCAMLNTEGGCLYIGVTNLGVGVGMMNDLKVPEFHESADAYDLYFRRQACTKFGKNADAYINSYMKNFAGRSVYVIEIKPCPQPVRLDGVIYERHGTSKLAMVGENERLFVERRLLFFKELMAASEAQTNKGVQPAVGASSSDEVVANPGVASDNKDAAKEVSSPEVVQPKPTEAASEEVIQSADASHVVKARQEDLIKVSKLRKETPLSYEESTVVRYIQFTHDSYKMMSEYYGPEEDVFLTLPIMEEDQDKYLILAYEDGKVCKISIENVLDKVDRQVNARYCGRRLVFAEIAGNNDLLMSVGVRKHEVECLRFDTIENLIEKETLTSIGEPVCSVQFERYSQFDIIPGLQKLAFKECVDLNAKQPGRAFKKSRDDKFFKKLKSMGIV